MDPPNPPAYINESEVPKPDDAKAVAASDPSKTHGLPGTSRERQPGTVSAQVWNKMHKTLNHCNLKIVHYKSRRSMRDAGMASRSGYHKRVQDIILWPSTLYFDELQELCQSRLELKMGEFGFKSLDGLQTGIVLRKKTTSKRIDVVDEQSWIAGKDLMNKQGYSLEYGVVKRVDGHGCTIQ
jgi:hypothetical protein